MRLSGAYKHLRSVFGGRGVDLSAGSGAPRRFGGAEKMTRHVEPPPRTTIFTTTRPVSTSKPEAQSEFGGKRWISSFGNYLGERRGSDLASVVRVGVGRVQST